MPQSSRRARVSRTPDGLPGAGDDRPVRLDLVRQVKAQISAGMYDSAAKVELAAERLALALDLTV